MVKKSTTKTKQYDLIGNIPAGFPVPSSDFTRSHLDLNELVIEHPAATYFVQVMGYSMIGAGINTGDLLVVDRSTDYKDGSIVIAVVDGEFTVKRVQKVNGKRYLVAENEKYNPIELREGMSVEIWGVVTYVVHKVV